MGAGNIKLSMTNKKPKQHGFTLMEMLVVSGMFSILIMVVASIFVSAIRTANNVLEMKKTLSQISYSVEYMTRAIRMAEKDTVGDCINRGDNYEISGVNNDSITFRNALQDDNCQEFFIQDEQLKHKINVGKSNEEILDLTSSDMKVYNLSFTANGEQQDDIFQPFITIYLEAQSSDSPILEIQTSVSQRNPDIRR